MLELAHRPPSMLGGAACMSSVRVDDEDASKRKAIVALGKALDEFRRLNPTMPVSQIQAFLLTAIDPSLSMSEVAEKTGIKISTTSRYLIDLGSPRTNEDTAYGLLERGIDPMEPRRARYLLSRKGKAMVSRIVNTLYGVCGNGDELVDISRKEGQ